jgi:hypothetical protein
LIPILGKGEPIHVLPREKRSGNTPRIFSSGRSSGSWRGFLRDYRKKIALLPKASNPVIKYLLSLSQEDRNLWTTLLPVTAVVRKSLEEEKPDAPELLEITRSWALEAVDRFL